MNVHHLELFYYVAKHGGVSAAARHMPYGIQQPAISAQILQLEDSLGATLFHRRPFQLTREGRDLFAFIEPFFGGLGEMATRLRGGAENRLRIATPEVVQRDYLPSLLQRVRRRVPGFQFSLHSGRVDEIERQLHDQSIDIGLATLVGKRAEGVRHHQLTSLTMVLLVHEKSGISVAEDIWRRDRIDLPLVTLPMIEPACRMFQEELLRLRVDWFPSLEVSSLDLVSRYVAEGHGVGLSLAAPGATWPEGVRTVPLPDFPAVPFGALWMGKLSPLGEIFIEEAERLARELFGRDLAAVKKKPRAKK